MNHLSAATAIAAVLLLAGCGTSTKLVNDQGIVTVAATGYALFGFGADVKSVRTAANDACKEECTENSCKSKAPSSSAVKGKQGLTDAVTILKIIEKIRGLMATHNFTKTVICDPRR